MSFSRAHRAARVSAPRAPPLTTSAGRSSARRCASFGQCVTLRLPATVTVRLLFSFCIVQVAPVQLCLVFCAVSFFAFCLCRVVLSLCCWRVCTGAVAGVTASNWRGCRGDGDNLGGYSCKKVAQCDKKLSGRKSAKTKGGGPLRGPAPFLR